MFLSACCGKFAAAVERRLVSASFFKVSLIFWSGRPSFLRFSEAMVGFLRIVDPGRDLFKCWRDRRKMAEEFDLKRKKNEQHQNQRNLKHNIAKH